jgi:hypothetical protein
MIKLKRMELTLQELNDIYYCLNKVKTVHPKMIDNESIDGLLDKIGDEIGRIVVDEVNEEINELKLTGKL